MSEGPTESKALTRIQIEGFRSLKSIDLSVGRVTVLIGPNGSGKSNLLSALRMISLMPTQSLRRFVGDSGGASALLHYGAKKTTEVRVRLEFDQPPDRVAYSARLGHAQGDAFTYRDETVEHRPGGAPEFTAASLGTGHAESRLDDAVDKDGLGPAKAVRDWLSQLKYFHFHDTSDTAALRQNSRQADDQYLRWDGSNLAAFLRRLASSEAREDQVAWRMIESSLRRIARYVKRLDPALVNPSKPDTSAVRLFWVDERDYRFGVQDFSDGTLRALAVFTALLQPASRLPAFIFIDEPELGLHPAAIGLLAGLVRSVSHRCQVVLATQSPALLDEFSPDEVVVAERTDGATVFRRLDAAGLAGWLEDYSLSELYDKNVLGGRP